MLTPVLLPELECTARMARSLLLVTSSVAKYPLSREPPFAFLLFAVAALFNSKFLTALFTLPSSSPAGWALAAWNDREADRLATPYRCK
ncbi:hypothetical protein C8F01DRAFT_1147495 [Mycena amicta]|nr:hypothetical protein C8F01DRAFT_1147495 [Mycena amicta]